MSQNFTFTASHMEKVSPDGPQKLIKLDLNRTFISKIENQNKNLPSSPMNSDKLALNPDKPCAWPNSQWLKYLDQL